MNDGEHWQYTDWLPQDVTKPETEEGRDVLQITVGSLLAFALIIGSIVGHAIVSNGL